MKPINWKEPQMIFMTIVLLICALGSYGYYEFQYTAKLSELEVKRTELQQARDTLVMIDRELSQKSQIETQLVNSQQELERLRNMFPSSEQVVNRLNDLHAVVTASGVDIRKFQPSALTQPSKDSLNSNDPRSFYNENYYDIEVVGGYHMIGTMFAQFANFKYPTSMFNLKVIPAEDINDQIANFENQGWTPKTVRLVFQLSTFTSRK